jgi:two-component system phosphate regulon sensor histidine kinase PhoR
VSFVWLRGAGMLLLTLAAALAALAAFGRSWALGVAAFGLLLMLLRHLVNLQALVTWLKNPQSVAVPHGSGVWEPVFTALYRFVRANNQQQHRLTTTLARFRKAGQALPDGVIVLDADDRIEWCNPIAEREYGLDIAKDAGQPIVNLVRQPDFVAYMKAGDFAEPLLMRLQRGEALVYSVRVVPYGQDQKLLLSRDITQAEKLETMRRDFVANVSHELKTPITVVSGFLETLADGKVGIDEVRGRQVIAIMREQSERMQRLIEDLLTLSTLESGAAPDSEVQIDMVRLVESLAVEARAISGGQHNIVIDALSPGWLEGNEQELRSAFGNLISNAVRYTPQGGSIGLAWTVRDGEGAFTVRDSGIGIDARHIPRLTERFYRVDSSRSRETGGTGLGLAIVKHVLTRHHAMLEIHSEPGAGSSFSAVFPARRIRTDAPAAAA